MSLFAASVQGPAVPSDEASNRDFMNALSQPLLIQTPLQMMLETLFSRAREQGVALLGTQEQLGKLAAENTALKAAIAEQDRKARSDLQDLRKFCLASLERDTSQDDKVLKQMQQDQQLLGKRLDNVETTAKDSLASVANISNRLDKEFKSRLDVLSQKLHGVDNILGHQLALSEMAGILGVGVPQVAPGTVPAEQPASATELVSPLAATSSQSEKLDDTYSTAPDPAPAEKVPAEHAVLPVAPVHYPKSRSTQSTATPSSTPQKSTGTPLAGLLPALKMQVEALEDKELEMRLHVEMLRDDMGLLKKELQATRAQVGDAVAITDKIDTRFHMLESEMRGMWKQIKDTEAATASDVAARPTQAAPAVVKAPAGKASEKAAGLSSADMSVVQDQLRASFEAIHDLKDKLDRTDKQLAGVQSSCSSTVSAAVDEVKAMTDSFQAQLCIVQKDMSALQNMAKESESVINTANQDLHKHADAINDLAHKMKRKLGPEDMHRIMDRAAAAAEAAVQQSLHGSAVDKGAAGASGSRCLSCNADLGPQRHMQMSSAAAKPPLLPRLLASEPGNAANASMPAASEQAPAPGQSRQARPSWDQSPRHSSSLSSAADTSSVSLPELAFTGRTMTNSPIPALWPNINTPVNPSPGVATMPPSLAARSSPAPPWATSPGPAFDDVNESHAVASGLPRQIEGVTKGDRRTPMGQLVGSDRRAWQMPTARDRPLTPVFTT